MNFTEIEKKLNSRKIPLAICMPEDDETVAAACEAAELGYVECYFVGNSEKIKILLEKTRTGFYPKIIAADTEADAAFKTVELVRNGEAKAIMKGTVSTPVLLKAILNSETGIKNSPVLSHVLVFEWEGRFKFLTDGGMIPQPTLEEKQEIIKNAAVLAASLGIVQPKIAVLSAVETVNFKMQSSVDAAILSKMGERKQFSGCIVEGPLALDNAISLESAHHKGLYNEVAGKADVLVCPDVDTGNILGKSLIYLARVKLGGVVIGAKAPIILLSRSDTKEIRLNSIRLALASNF